MALASNKKPGFYQKEKNEQENNETKMMMITTPIFFNKIQNYGFNKENKKKNKPFIEREGDWICKICKNLNFAFRLECNRCKVPKDSESKVIKNVDIKNSQALNNPSNSISINNYNLCSFNRNNEINN